MPGTVKTRLAAAIGEEAAAALYRACVELILSRLASFQSESIVCVDPPNAVDRMREWLGPGWACEPQRGADLGERLAHATARAFSQGAGQVVVIGTDSPWLTPADLTTAFNRLEHADLVLGPTDDGGYYAIGFSRPCPAVFEGVAWGTPAVCSQTQSIARARGMRLGLLRRGYDVDHLKDLARFLEEERRNGVDPMILEPFSAVSERRAPCPS